MSPCKVCGWVPDTNIAPGILRDLRFILGPKLRTTANRMRETLCWFCQVKVARLLDIVL